MSRMHRQGMDLKEVGIRKLCTPQFCITPKLLKAALKTQKAHGHGGLAVGTEWGLHMGRKYWAAGRGPAG